MNARDILEAESPKDVFMNQIGNRVTTVRLANLLVPKGWDWNGLDAPGFKKAIKGVLWVIRITNNGGAEIDVYKRPYDPKNNLSRAKAWQAQKLDNDTQGPWTFSETIRLSGWESLLRHMWMLQILNENVLSLDPEGNLNLDDRPKAPNSIWTYRRKDKLGNPAPYVRTRQLPNGKPLEIVVAFKKDHAPTELLGAAKSYGPEVAKMAKVAADHVAWTLFSKAPIHIVMPLPSHQPLARRFGRLVAKELGAVFVEDALQKTQSLSKLPVWKRHLVAQGVYSVEGRFRGKTVCIVDDYIVTGSSMTAAAIRLYEAGAKRVIGAALAI